MAIVHLSSGLSQWTGGVEELAIDAARVLDLKRALVERFPGVEAHLEQMAVAVDGEIYNDADYLRLDARSEIFFVPRVSGG
jgi:molybdopterin converting factor small subunit